MNEKERIEKLKEWIDGEGRNEKGIDEWIEKED